MGTSMEFDGREYFRERNESAGSEYRDCAGRLEAVIERRKGEGPYDSLFRGQAGWLLDLVSLEERFCDDYFDSATLDDLERDNLSLWRDIEPGSYPGSLLDPAGAVAVFGDGYGQLLSYFCLRCRSLIPHAYQHRRYRMAREIGLFLEVEEAVNGEEPPPYDDLRMAVTRLDRSDNREELQDLFTEIVDPGFRFYGDIARRAGSPGFRHLYRFGCRVSGDALRTAAFIDGAGTGLASKLADSVVDAYIRGFEADGKTIDERRVVTVSAPLGYEPVVNSICGVLEDRDLVPLVRAPIHRPVNRQYANDHRFDYVLFFDEDVSGLHSGNRREALAALSESCRLYSGRIIFIEFGEEPFSPERKPECLRPDEALASLWRSYEMEGIQALVQYLPRTETSFTAIAFPSPDIRGDFERIFEDTMVVNTLDSREYETMQQKIIDVLDTADHVRIRGAGGNRTDLRVSMKPLSDPGTETRFLNCIDTVNIPLGEVFTSPALNGTNGVLHVEEAFLGGLRFDDLTLTFRDGYVVDYECGNFPDAGENRKYISENLLYPHDTLPMGEFAIGSNTHAYAMARRHGIMDLLPVLIIEKMGPHFAIGDTCFMHEEDHVVRNRTDGKEVTARDNERSALRAEDPSKAYTNRHIDITLPYSSLDSISAVLPDGEEIFVIRGGRFVLDGTEALNVPIDAADVARTRAGG
jgi:aminopeptidase